ncbi:MAG: hypothetical protein JO065_04640, partial [Acidobacteria bacterium]|nr:hypothetical protein [Acidobacteriota bacterium]
MDLIVAIFQAAIQLTAATPSDIILSPGRPPQLQVSGKLVSLDLAVLTPNDTARIANDLTGKNERALKRL